MILVSCTHCDRREEANLLSNYSYIPPGWFELRMIPEQKGMTGMFDELMALQGAKPASAQPLSFCSYACLAAWGWLQSLVKEDA